MNLGFSGADVDQLEALSQRFDAQAARIQAIITSSSSLLFVTEWTGANVERLRSDWSRSARPTLTALVSSLQHNAQTLKREAQEQRGASSGASSRNDVRRQSLAGDARVYRRGPANTSDLVNGILGMVDKHDAFRVQEVMGEDKVIRLIVYISGTGSADPTSGLMSWDQNVAASFGMDTPTRTHLEGLIDDAVKNRPDAEIMIVGHSQGGMYAEAIAASGRYKVAEVITLGAPGVPVPNGYGGANVTRLQHIADWVVNGVEPGRALLGAGGLAATIFGSAGGLDQSGEIETFRRGNPYEGPIDNPLVPWEYQAHKLAQGDYNWLADEFDSSTDPSTVAARERQARFLNGTVIFDSDPPVE